MTKNLQAPTMTKGGMTRTPHTAWRKSSHSGSGDNINRVEVAGLADGTIAIRASKTPTARPS
jgi:hypothetical protein